MASLSQDSSLLVLGAGTWGCSVALELARRGYKRIKVLDAFLFPSPIAAGNDLNKIAEEANAPSDDDSPEDYFWNRVHQLAMDSWKNDALFNQFYHPTGFIMAACADEAYEHVVQYAETEQTPLVPLKTKEDFQATMPEGVLTGQFPGWRGYWKRTGAGWVSASDTLRAMHTEATRLGVQFVTGVSQGKVKSLLYSSDKDSVRGVLTADGIEHQADQTVLVAGANSDLLLDFKKQLRPTAWTLAHIPLGAEEARNYKDLPVLYGVDRGFFIEPDVRKYELKICDEHPGYCNFIKVDGELRSVPFARQQIPVEAERRMRRLLQETMPHLAERKFSFARICWDVDTVDRVFLIDKHPELKNLVVGVGGSGNGFMTNPAVGKLVADVVENKAEERLRKVMRWRPEISVDRDWWNTQNRFGADGKVVDFSDVKEWTSIGL